MNRLARYISITPIVTRPVPLSHREREIVRIVRRETGIRDAVIGLVALTTMFCVAAVVLDWAGVTVSREQREVVR